MYIDILPYIQVGRHADTVTAAFLVQAHKPAIVNTCSPKDHVKSAAESCTWSFELGTLIAPADHFALSSFIYWQRHEYTVFDRRFHARDRGERHLEVKLAEGCHIQGRTA
jgi:hypothetical protein